MGFAEERLTAMNAISRPLTIYHVIPTDAHADAAVELARHHFDLRVHSLVMLSSAVLAGYCGIRVLDFGDSTALGESMKVAMAPDFLSVCALAMFFAIAALCLLEARRGWRKANMAGPRNVSRIAMARGPLARLTLGLPQ
jgi:hypothetical protein